MKTRNKYKKNVILEKIYEMGAAQGLSPRKVWAKAGFHPNYAGQSTNPRIDTLERLATAVGGKIDFVNLNVKEHDNGIQKE